MFVQYKISSPIGDSKGALRSVYCLGYEKRKNLLLGNETQVLL